MGSEDSIKSEDASEVENLLRAKAAAVLYSLSPAAEQQDIRVLQVKSMQNATSHHVAEWVTQHGVSLDFVIDLHHAVMHLTASMFILSSDTKKDAMMSATIEDLETEDQEEIATMQASALFLDLIDELSELAAMTQGLAASNASLVEEDENTIVVLLETELKWTVKVPTQIFLFTALQQPLQFMLSKAKVKMASVMLVAKFKEQAKVDLFDSNYQSLAEVWTQDLADALGLNRTTALKTQEVVMRSVLRFITPDFH